ncbi:DMT family transporter [Synechococcus sp. Nb3U1]|uniref:DMT family transporter n=1 Tax=Synechococcus sp. Nb3U1 TaxID=1914529 RepID=UPI001F1D3A9F|nr:DMT family transporter [Synechococcus sp. Nb3U1]MCF2972539.1 DMT family transporter [Synechococcus sp. Nb3U1]
MNLEIWQAGLAAGVGGVLFTLAFAFNSRLHRSIHSPLAASAISFSISFLFVGSLVGLWGEWNISSLGQAPWWAFWGGATGSCSIILSLLALPRIGLVALGIASVFGQLGFSLLIEQFGLTTLVSGVLGAKEVLGLVLILVAVALIQSQREVTPPAESKAESIPEDKVR